jgi:hypothetical protein
VVTVVVLVEVVKRVVVRTPRIVEVVVNQLVEVVKIVVIIVVVTVTVDAKGEKVEARVYAAPKDERTMAVIRTNENRLTLRLGNANLRSDFLFLFILFSTSLR